VLEGELLHLRSGWKKASSEHLRRPKQLSRPARSNQYLGIKFPERADYEYYRSLISFDNRNRLSAPLPFAFQTPFSTFHVSLPSGTSTRSDAPETAAKMRKSVQTPQSRLSLL
jgi:hypothetical protein